MNNYRPLSWTGFLRVAGCGLLIALLIVVLLFSAAALGGGL